MNGQSLYELYCKVFKTIFAPTWPALTEDSRASWNALALEINNQQWIYMRGIQSGQLGTTWSDLWWREQGK